MKISFRYERFFHSGISTVSAFMEKFLQFNRRTFYEKCKVGPPSKIKNMRKIFRVSIQVGGKVVNPPSGYNLCESYLTQPDLHQYPTMSPISYRKVARKTSIRTRYKSFSFHSAPYTATAYFCPLFVIRHV